MAANALNRPQDPSRNRLAISRLNGLQIGSGRTHKLKSRFEMIDKLGEGTYGKVQLAINKETKQEFAVKTIKKSKITCDKDLERIQREIQIMSSIEHPNIIHIYEVFENRDKIVLIMQFAKGGELFEYVRERKQLSDNEARRLFRQIATAVYYCHKSNICHRDLKLENILLDEKGNAKIGDFGLSNVFDLKNRLSTYCGSPLYASPEIVKGLPYYGPETDCWSLGVILYTLVYGAMPFYGSNQRVLVKLISEAKYFEPSDAKNKSDASSLIRKLLCVQPNKRATIIDICTDQWVNKDCERCLLQVAEDLLNLTPVKVEILLALAPRSQLANPPSNDNERKKSNPDPNKVTVLEPNDEQNVKRRKSTKKSDGKKSKDKENDSKSSKTKALKEESLDENKKSIKSSQQSKNSLNHDSDYVSEEPVSLSRKSDVDKGSRSTINQSIVDLNEANKSSSANKTESSTGNGVLTRKVSVKKISSKTDDKSKKDEQSKESLPKPNKPEIKEEQCSTSSINLVRKPSTKTRTVTTKTTAPSSSNSVTNIDNKDNKDNKEITIKDLTSKDSTAKETNKEPVKEANKSNKKVLGTQQSIEITKENQVDDQSNKEQMPIRTQSKIVGDAKRMFEKPRRQESIEREKQERIIFLNKVSDVKNKFERRASVNAASAALWSKPYSSTDTDKIKKKMSLTDNSITASVINTLTNNSEQINASPAKVHANTVNDNHSKPIDKHSDKHNDNDNVEVAKESNKVASKEALVDKKEMIEKAVEKVPEKIVAQQQQPQPMTTTTSISTIKPKLIERQISASSSSNNPPTGNDRSNLKVRRHTVKAKTSSSTATVPTIAELKRKTDLFTTKDKVTDRKPPIIETIKETEVSNHPPLSPTTKTSTLTNNSNNSSNSSISKSTIIEQPMQVTSPKRSTPPPYSNVFAANVNTQSSPIRSPTPTSMQNHVKDDIPLQHNNSSNSMEIRPKLKIISNTNQTPSSKLFTNSQSMGQNSSIQSTNSQESFSGGLSNSQSIQTKLAPISRSYKKISFTKDGQAITETGRIISEETPSGTKITKKIVTKKSNAPGDHLYESRTNQSLDSETDEYTSTMNDRIKSRSSVLNNHSNASSSTIRRSDSNSSSESVDIFDMDFDQWIGDSMFNNISSKFKSLFNQTPGLFNSNDGLSRKSNSPFPSFLNRNKPSLSKRAESCERKYNDENQMNIPTSNGLGLRRRQGYATEGESDTDNEDNMQNIGLWKLGKFLKPNVTTRFLNRNSSLMNGMDFFNDDLNNQSNLLNRSRERLKFDSKPPTAGLSSRYKSASRDLGDSNDQVFKTTFTIRPNSAAKIVTTTSRNNSGSNLSNNNQNIQMSNSMTNSMPSSRAFERMNSDHLFEFEPDMNAEFKTNFPMTIGKIRTSNSQTSQPLSPQIQNSTLTQFNSPRILNRSISNKPSTNSRSFMDAGNYRGLNIGRVHEIPIEIQQQESNKTTINNTQKEYYIPITRQENNSQVEQENNSNSLLDQLRTHGYRNLVNQRNSKLSNNFNVPITNENEEVNNKNGQNIQIINKITNKRGKNELDDEFKSKLNSNEQSMPKMYKSLICTKESDLNELDVIKPENSSFKDYKLCSNHNQLQTNHHYTHSQSNNDHNTKTNQLTKQFDYKGLKNVARELNYFSDLKANLSSASKLTKKYSVSSKSLEHLNSINFINSTKNPSRLFNVYIPETTTTKLNQDENQDKSSDEDKKLSSMSNGLKTDKFDSLSERKQDRKLDSELNESNLKLVPNARKSSRRKSIDNEEDTTLESETLDESIITPSSTSSMLKLLNGNSNCLNHSSSIDDLKNEYLNCSINNQVDQIQQLIKLLYQENDNLEEDEDNDKLGRSCKKSSQLKQDNYQLLRKTSKGLKELKNNLQILQLKNKLKRRLAEERSMQSKNELRECLKSSNRDSLMSTDTSATTTVTPTSDEDDDLITYRRNLKSSSFKSLPPLPPQSSINNNSNDRLMNDNLIKSNKRMTDVNCLTKNNLTNQSKFNDNQKNYLQPLYNQIPFNSLSNSSCNQLNKEHGMSNSIVSNCDQKFKNQSKHIFSSSTRSTASLNGHLNSINSVNGNHQLATSSTSSSSSSSDLVKHHNSLHSALDIQSDSGSTRELHRRSTIGNGSSKETMQERILRKSYYTRFNSPDRTNLDNQNRMRRKSAFTDYLNNIDDYLSESNDKGRSQRSKSITRSISSLNNRDEDDNCSMTSSITNENEKDYNKRTSLNRTTFNHRTSHSPYRTNNVQKISNVTNDLDDELSDEELLNSLSSVNRRNSFAYGSAATGKRYAPTSLQASFERNLANKQKSTLNNNDDHLDLKRDDAAISSRLKRNSIAQLSDYNNNSNLFRSNLSSLRSKINESNGLLDDKLFKNDLSSNQLNKIRKSIELST